ncbi:hypothetical protein ACHAPJ_000397 [Fusarium lateritium]
MSHRRISSRSQTQSWNSGNRGSGSASYGAVDAGRYTSPTSEIAHSPDLVIPGYVWTDTGDCMDEQSSYDLDEHDLEGPSPHGTYYTTTGPRNASSYPEPLSPNRGSSFPNVNGYTRGGHHSGNEFPRSIPYSETGHPRGGSYSGNFSQRGRYATSYQNRRAYSASHGGRSLRQTYPSDHYDEAGNYIGPPAVNSYFNDLVSFPRIPDPEPSPTTPENDLETRDFEPRASISNQSRRTLSQQLVNGVRNLLTSDTGSTEPEIPPQPARTGVYLFCRHYLIEECACITPLETNGDGDYCQRCWEGRCNGPRPPGSVPRRTLW